jgi:flagellar hook-basal body complex protein FliE
MAFDIRAISSIPMPAAPSAAPRAKGGFDDVLAGAMRDVEGFQRQAGQAVHEFLSGEGGELHTAALAAQKAEVSFELFLQARNKVVQAYQEIMRMQL